MDDEHLDLLISRLAGDEAAETDWVLFRRAADESPGLWRDLALAQRDHAEIVRSINDAVAVSDRVDLALLPEPGMGDAAERTDEIVTASHPEWHMVLGRIGGWIGWGAAAILTVVVIVRGMIPPTPSAPEFEGVELVRTPDEALSDYLAVGRESGRVVGEAPRRVLLDARPAADGNGYELIYYRQILERALVPELYHFDEQNGGNATLARWDADGDSM